MWIALAFLALLIAAILSVIFGFDQNSLSTDGSVEANKGRAMRISQAFSSVKAAFDNMQFDGVPGTEIQFRGAMAYDPTTVGCNVANQTANDPVHQYCGADYLTDTTSTEFAKQLFEPTIGKISPAPIPPVDASAVTTNNPERRRYAYRQYIRLQSADAVEVGSTGWDIVMLYPDIRQTVCTAFNNIVYGDSATDPSLIPAAGASLSAITASSLTAPVTVVTSRTGLPPRLVGCVVTNDNHYVAYQVLKVR